MEKLFCASDFFASPYHETYLEENVGGRKFRFRVMDGKERIEFADIHNSYQRVFFAISRCLIDSGTNAVMSPENVEKFITQSNSLATRLANRIIERTDKIIDEEIRILEQAEKNSGPTHGSPVGKPTAPATD